MKVINKTHYDTFYLRKLFLAAEKRMFKIYLKHTRPKHRHVTIKYGRRTTISGYAWYNSYSVVMKLPKNNIPNAQDVVQVYIHEVGHCLGLKHNKMVPVNRLDVSWWPNEPIQLKKLKPPKPKLNIIEARAGKAQKKLNEWTQKLNRAKTFVKKYQKKVRYYENKMAASKNN